MRLLRAWAWTAILGLPVLGSASCNLYSGCVVPSLPQGLPSFCEASLVFLAASTSNCVWQEENKSKGQKGSWEGVGEEDSTDYVLDAVLLDALIQHLVLFPQTNLIVKV